MLLIFEKEKKNDFSKNYFFLNRGDPYGHFLKKKIFFWKIIFLLF